MTDLAASPVRRNLAAAARSDAGRVRTNNEDLPVLDAERGVFGVIDGVGGQAAGELAASIARDVILQRMARPLGTPAERVREAIAIANNEIFRRAGTSPELAGMTCVVTVAIVGDGRLTIGHVGDTRLYKIHRGGIRKLTHDHSPVGEREDAGELSESDARRHPRRHEVFRDVGSALRDKDEDEYVEVVEDAMEDDAAILVCSDGLTDMIGVETIRAIVTARAGDPQAVGDALVAAANSAGGRDNVTVVYAEGPRFAAAMRALAARAPTTAGGDAQGPATDAAPIDEPGRGPFGRAVRALVTSRLTWFTCGVAIGALAALLYVWRVSDAASVGVRTIVAAPAGSTAFTPLATALAQARTGDVIRLEPGTYAERIVVPSGVSITARVPGASTFVRGEMPPGTGEWVAITATGDDGGGISGVRVVSTPTEPVDVAVRVVGQGRALILLDIEDAARAGLELLDGSTASMQGSRVAVVEGAAVHVAAGAGLDASGNVFVRRGMRAPVLPKAPAAPVEPAISIGDGATAVLRRNVFAGFGIDPVRGLPDSEREPLRAANVVVSAGVPSLR